MGLQDFLQIIGSGALFGFAGFYLAKKKYDKKPKAMKFSFKPKEEK